MSTCAGQLFENTTHNFWQLRPSVELADVVGTMAPMKQLVASMPTNGQGQSKQEDLEEYLWYAPRKGQVHKYPGQRGGLTLLKHLATQRLDQKARTVVSALTMHDLPWLVGRQTVLALLALRFGTRVLLRSCSVVAAGPNLFLCLKTLSPNFCAGVKCVYLPFPSWMLEGFMLTFFFFSFPFYLVAI